MDESTFCFVMCMLKANHLSAFSAKRSSNISIIICF